MANYCKAVGFIYVFNCMNKYELLSNQVCLKEEKTSIVFKVETPPVLDLSGVGGLSPPSGASRPPTPVCTVLTPSGFPTNRVLNSAHTILGLATI